MTQCPNGGEPCPEWLCDCFIRQCPACAAGNCPQGGIHPEMFTVGEVDQP